MAQIAMLGATCSYGFAAIYGRRFKSTSLVITNCGLLIGATILLLPLALFEAPWTLRPSFVAIGAVTAMAIFGTAIAFMIWLHLVGTVGANNTALVTFLIPISALFLGMVVLGESIAWSAYLGLGLILLGLAVIQLVPSSLSERK